MAENDDLDAKARSGPPPVGEEGARREIEALRDRWRQYGYLPLLELAVSRSAFELERRNPERPLEYLQTLPWVNQRLIQWVLADPGCAPYGIFSVRRDGYDRLLREADHLIQSTASRYLLQRTGIAALRAIAFLQFVHQEAFPYGPYRDFCILNDLSPDSSIRRVLAASFRMEPVDLIAASLNVTHALDERGMNSFTASEIALAGMPLAKLLAFLRGLSLDSGGLRSRLKSRKFEISLESAMQQSVFREVPLLQIGRRFHFWGHALALNGINHWLYERLRDTGRAELRAEYGQAFERYVRKALTHMPIRIVAEEDVRATGIDSDRMTDFIIPGREATIFVESKVRAPDGATQVALDLGRIGDRLDTSIIHAISQGQSAARLAIAGRLAALGVAPESEPYLIIVGPFQHYMGSGLHIERATGGERIERLRALYGGRLPIPLENVVMLTADGLDAICAASQVNGKAIFELVKRMRDSVTGPPGDQVMVPEQLILRLGPVVMPPHLIEARDVAFDQVRDAYPGH